MKSADKYGKLLKELGRDKRLKQVIARTRRPQNKPASQVEGATGLFLLLSALVSRFSKKKRARKIDELADFVQLLVQISLALKDNVFDRPEVKKFFRSRYRKIYRFTQQLVSGLLPQSRATRPRNA